MKHYKLTIGIALLLLVSALLVGCECNSTKYKCTPAQLNLVEQEMNICTKGDGYCHVDSMKETHCTIIKTKKKR